MVEPGTTAALLKLLSTPFVKLGEALFSGYKKRNQQPTLSVRLQFNNSFRTNKGLSTRNNFPPIGEAIPYDMVGSLNHFYDLGWTYEMHITNDSEYSAYQLYVVEHEGITLTFEPAFDYTKPIGPNETVRYEMKAFYYMFEGVYTQADATVKKGPIDVFRI